MFDLCRIKEQHSWLKFFVLGMSIRCVVFLVFFPNKICKYIQILHEIILYLINKKLSCICILNMKERGYSYYTDIKIQINKEILYQKNVNLLMIQLEHDLFVILTWSLTCSYIVFKFILLDRTHQV
jgi:hypothetical protein